MTLPGKIGGDSRGVALAVVLYALVTLGLLASASFLLALQERRSAKHSIDLVVARASAEGSADSIVLHWNALIYNAIPVSDSLRVRVAAPGEQGTHVMVTRLADSLFLVRAETSIGLTRQQVSVIARLKSESCLNGGAESPESVGDVNCYFTTSSTLRGGAVQFLNRGWLQGS